MTTVTARPLLSTPEGRFRVAGVAEACSWAGLLVGMVVKYVVIKNPVGVQVFGSLHGLMFLCYLAATVLCARAHSWSARLTGLGVLASIPPFGTLVFERWAARSGQLRRTRR